MADTEEDWPPIGSVWVNTKQGNNYVIVGIAIYTEDNLSDKVLVLYRRHNVLHGTLFARPVTLFNGYRVGTDGGQVKRFERLS